MLVITVQSIWHKVCGRLFAFWKTSTANLQILWHHLAMELHNI